MLDDDEACSLYISADETIGPRRSLKLYFILLLWTTAMMMMVSFSFFSSLLFLGMYRVTEQPAALISRLPDDQPRQIDRYTTCIHGRAPRLERGQTNGKKKPFLFIIYFIYSFIFLFKVGFYKLWIFLPVCLLLCISHP